MTDTTELAVMLTASPAPIVTHYDLATGERTELSRATLRNWQAKIAGFLVNDLEVEPATRVRLALPTHWLRFAWLAACWRVGADVTDALTEPADIGVCGPELVAGEPVKVASALLPLGARFPAAPLGFLDMAVEVPPHPDVFEPWEEPIGSTPALDVEGARQLDHAELWRLCAPSDARLLLTPGSLLRDSLALVSACRGSGSLVTVTGGSAADLDRIAGQERVTAVEPVVSRRS